MKNAGLGFAIPYLHNGQTHDYVPDFIVRLQGHRSPSDPRNEGLRPAGRGEAGAAERWVAAVNADGRYGVWSYSLTRDPSLISHIIDTAAAQD